MNRDDANVFTRACLIALFVVLASAAFASEKLQYDCESVRAFVEQHGKVKALALAIENGATWAQIKQARACLAKR